MKLTTCSLPNSFWPPKGFVSKLSLSDPVIDETEAGVLGVLRTLVYPAGGPGLNPALPEPPTRSQRSSLSGLNKIQCASLVAQTRICLKCSRPGFDPWVGKIPKRRGCTNPVFLPGESHGQRSLENYSPQGHKETDTTERVNTQKHTWFDTLHKNEIN